MLRKISVLVITLLFGCILIYTQAVQAKAKPVDKAILASESFINAHPDLMHRTRGLKAYKKLEYSQAYTHFRRGAKFSDKPSQGMVAEMLWKGEGVEINRPLAYAWMDLAAERYYPTMLLNREKYWEAMTATEREQALVLGKDVYATYGDEVAKPRLASALRRAKSQTTGSRTGFVGSMTITINTPSGPQTIDGSEYYQDKFWKPEEYAKWQDGPWKKPPTGRVDIGPLQSEPETKPEVKDNK
jgi:uncharacterized protein